MEDCEKVCKNCGVLKETDRLRKADEPWMGIAIKHCAACSRNPGTKGIETIIRVLGGEMKDNWVEVYHDEGIADDPLLEEIEDDA